MRTLIYNMTGIKRLGSRSLGRKPRNEMDREDERMNDRRTAAGGAKIKEKEGFCGIES